MGLPGELRHDKQLTTAIVSTPAAYSRAAVAAALRGQAAGSSLDCKGFENLNLVPRDAFRTRFFLAPTSLLLIVEAGGFLSKVQVDMKVGMTSAYLVPHHHLGAPATISSSEVIQLSLKRTTRESKAGSVDYLHARVGHHLLLESTVLATVDKVPIQKCVFTAKGCLFIVNSTTSNIFYFTWLAGNSS
jgi:hypothetical protein